jgi:hypothetical protein
VSTFSSNLSTNSSISTEGNSNDVLELECNERPASFDFARSQNEEAALAAEFEQKIRLVPASSLVCLRMSMKFSESQEGLFAHIVP